MCLKQGGKNLIANSKILLIKYLALLFLLTFKLYYMYHGYIIGLCCCIVVSDIFGKYFDIIGIFFNVYYEIYIEGI